MKLKIEINVDELEKAIRASKEISSGNPSASVYLIDVFLDSVLDKLNKVEKTKLLERITEDD